MRRVCEIEEHSILFLSKTEKDKGWEVPSGKIRARIVWNLKVKKLVGAKLCSKKRENSWEIKQFNYFTFSLMKDSDSFGSRRITLYPPTRNEVQMSRKCLL